VDPDPCPVVAAGQLLEEDQIHRQREVVIADPANLDGVGGDQFDCAGRRKDVLDLADVPATAELDEIDLFVLARPAALDDVGVGVAGAGDRRVKEQGVVSRLLALRVRVLRRWLGGLAVLGDGRRGRLDALAVIGVRRRCPVADAGIVITQKNVLARVSTFEARRPGGEGAAEEQVSHQERARYQRQASQRQIVPRDRVGPPSRRSVFPVFFVSASA